MPPRPFSKSHDLSPQYLVITKLHANSHRNPGTIWAIRWSVGRITVIIRLPALAITAPVVLQNTANSVFRTDHINLARWRLCNLYIDVQATDYEHQYSWVQCLVTVGPWQGAWDIQAHTCDSVTLTGRVGHPGAYSRLILTHVLVKKLDHGKDEQWTRLDHVVYCGGLLWTLPRTFWSHKMGECNGVTLSNMRIRGECGHLLRQTLYRVVIPL